MADEIDTGNLCAATPVAPRSSVYTPLLVLVGACVVIALASLGFASDWGSTGRHVTENRKLIDATAEVVAELGKASTQTRIDMAYIRGSLEQLLREAGLPVPIPVGNHRPHGG